MGFRWLRFFRRGHTALCLNSSYFGFYAHAGFLQGLKELQLHPEHVSGASAGGPFSGLPEALDAVLSHARFPVLVDLDSAAIRN